MKKHLLFKVSLILSLILLIFISCVSDIDLSNISKTAKIDQSIGLPIGEANLSIKDLLKKFGLPSNIDTLSNEIFYQASTEGVYNFRPFNLIDSVKPYVKSFSSIITKTVKAFDSIPDIPVNDNLGLGINSNTSEQRVDTIKIKSAAINVRITLPPDLASIPESAVTVEFIFPKDKLKFNDGKNPSFKPTQFGVYGLVNLGACTIYAAGATSIPFTIVVHTRKLPFPITLNPASFVKLELNFTSIELDQAWGLFRVKVSGNRVLTLPFDLQSYLPNAFLRFDNPTVDIKASTNIGADLTFNLDFLKLYNSATPNNVSWAWFGNPKYLTSSEFLVGPTVLGDSTSTKFRQLNKDNGETYLLTDTKPYLNTINFQYSISSNTFTSRTQNFITGDSKIDFNINTRIPMSFQGGSNYIGIDTIKNVGNSIGATLDGLDSALLVLKFNSQLPVKAFYRMTFWKSNAINDTIANSNISTVKNDSTTASIFSQFQINAPQINADGSVKEGVVNSQTIQIGLNKKEIDYLKSTSFIIFKLELGSEIVNGVANPVHFTTKNSLSVRLGVMLKPNTTVNLVKTK